MEELKNLTEIIKHKSQRSLQLVNQNFRKKETSKDNLLFKGLVKEVFETDEAASKHLFKADPGNRNYRNTKAKLKKKLLNHLYFLDYKKSDYTAFQNAKYECLHGIHQAKILFMENQSCIAVRRLPGVIKLAREFELVEIVLEALLLLRKDFANKGKCAPLIQTAAEIEEINPFYKDILISEELYYDTMVLINKSATSCERIMEQIPERIDRIQFLSKKHQSKRLDILSQKLTIAYNNVNKNHEDNNSVCTYLENSYLSKNYSEITVDLNFKEIAQLKLVSLFSMGNHDEAIAYAQDHQTLFKVGSNEWFLFKEYHFLVLMALEKYNQATKVFRV